MKYAPFSYSTRRLVVLFTLVLLLQLSVAKWLHPPLCLTCASYSCAHPQGYYRSAIQRQHPLELQTKYVGRLLVLARGGGILKSL